MMMAESAPLFKSLQLRRRWFVYFAPFFCILLSVSLSAFLAQPNWRVLGVAWNALFQIFAPTIGSALVIMLAVGEAVAKRINPIAAASLIGIVVLVSAICLYWSMPVLMNA